MLAVLAILATLAPTRIIAQPDPRARPYLSAAMDNDLVRFANIDVPALENIEIINRGSQRFLALHILPGQKLHHGGIRAEISVDYPYESGDAVSYQWRMRLAPNFTADPQNRWWLLAQWHDQPDTGRGETWDGFPGRSPPIALSYGRVDGVDRLAVSYGAPEQRAVASTPVERAVWLDLRAEIHWSTGPDGWARFYLNGAAAPFAAASGPNMHNRFQHYLKLGMYRDPAIQGRASLWLDGLTIGHFTPQ